MAKPRAIAPVVEDEQDENEQDEQDEEAVTGEIVDAEPDAEILARLNEQQSIITADISSYLARTQEVQARVGRALNVIRANGLWRAARDANRNPFKSYSAYLAWLGDETGYSRTNYLRMQKDDVQAYIESGEAPEQFEAPESRGGASGVKFTTLPLAADVTLRQLDALFDRWGERAMKVQKNVDGEKVEDGTLFNLLTQAQAAMVEVREQLVTLSAIGPDGDDAPAKD